MSNLLLTIYKKVSENIVEEIVKKIIENTFYRFRWSSRIAVLSFKLIDFFRYRILPEKVFLRLIFKKRLGYQLNLGSPKTINEKFQWLKLNDRRLINTQCSDKYLVRDYISKTLGSQFLIPILYNTKNPFDLLNASLPDIPFIIKCNHDSSGGLIVWNKELIDIQTEVNRLYVNLSRNYFYHKREWQYKNIEPRIVIEKLLFSSNHKIPDDYKLHCFNGKLKYIQVDIDRHIDHKRNIYNANWELQKFEWEYPSDIDRALKKPLLLDEMKELAEKIAKDFIYIRVDLYEVEGKIYFGELTFHPEAGLGKILPKEYDVKMGQELILPIDRA